MTNRRSSTEWKGSLEKGPGSMRLGSGAYEGQFTFASRFKSSHGTNPQELVGVAHAGCYSMVLSALRRTRVGASRASRFVHRSRFAVP